MTHAQAVALRDANRLDPRCQIVITDGPVIGTAGNTSPTQIELNPVGPGDIGRTARVHTTFDNVAFSSSSYNIDGSAPGGDISQLTDQWSNNITDEDPSAPTVHTQFPYHRSGPNMRDNVINDSILPGWDTATGTINDNVVRNSTVDLTGKTSGTFQLNTVVNTTLTANTAASFIANNNVDGAVISHVGAGAGSFSFQNNAMLTGVLTVDAATTSTVTFNNNVTGGAAGGYRTEVVNKTGQPFIMSGNRLFNSGVAAYDLRAGGPATVTVTSNDIGAGTVTLDNSGTSSITGNKLSGAVLNKAGTGGFFVANCALTGGTVTHNASSTALLSLSDSTQEQINVTLAAGSAGTVGIIQGNVGSLFVNHQGTGNVTVAANSGRPAVTTAVGSTRGLSVTANTGRGTIVQNGTGNTAIDTVLGCLFQDGQVNFNSTLAGTGVNTVSATIDGQATVNVQDAAGPNCVTQTRVGGLSVLNVQPGGSVSRCRFDADIEVNTGAFSHINSIAEGDFVLSPTASNANKLLNKSFSDWT